MTKKRDKRISPIVIIIAVVILAIAILFLIDKDSSIEKDPLTIINVKGQTIQVEVADNLVERGKGLMFREHLDENKGMLFVFNDEQTRTFWMKNTLIALDLLFIDDDLLILDIHSDFQPCKREPCPTYSSIAKSMYVLEVNGGYSNKHGIRVGDSIEIIQQIQK